MTHPFEEGKTYRNRRGEYVVQAIDGDRMVIKYVDGGTLETSARIQARIWENIHFEEQMVREQEKERLFGKDRRGEQCYEIMREQHPDARGIVSISRAGFDASLSKAVVYVGGSVCGHGGGNYVLLIKQGDAWTFQGWALSWRS